MISNRPFPIAHMWCPASYGLLYGLFNFFYIYVFKATNASGKPYIYNILDWNNEERNLTGIHKNDTGYYFETNGAFINESYYSLPDNLKYNSGGLGESWATAIGLLIAFGIFYLEFYGLAKLRDYLWAKYYHKNTDSSKDIVAIENPAFEQNSENIDAENPDTEK